MSKVYFKNDYSELAAPEVLAYMAKISNGHYNGYGLDEICESAADRIKKELQYDNCDVHFMGGGTQTNLVMLDQILRSYEAVAAVSTGHINVHESGSIERTGHKIEPLPSHNGKMCAADLEDLLRHRTDEHMVKIGAAYISQSTETGTVYSKKELQELKRVCSDNGIYLFVDGARLGVALMCDGSDLKMSDMPYLCDAFYIGATKNGGMLGEALVIVNDDLKPHFRNAMKQHGALLAKGFVVGAQFDALFTDGLYYRLAQHSNTMALNLKKKLQEKGIELTIDSPTNQQFIRLPNEKVKELENNFAFEIWEDGPEYTVIRLVCSWATREEDINKLLKAL